MRVLLLEDTERDKEIVQACVADCGFAELQHVETGEEIEELIAEIVSRDVDAPDLILLDLAVDGVGDFGLQVLRKIRSLSEIRHIPVVIFSQSKVDKTVYDSYASGANSFVHKTIEKERLKERVEQMLEFWGKSSKMPGNTVVTVDIEATPDLD